jgi:hypothetical protein
MDSAAILHATALAKTYATPKRKIKLIRDSIEQKNDKMPPKRHIKLMREPFKEKVVKKEEKKEMPPRKKHVDILPPIQEKVTMVHVAMLEKKMAVLPVEDVETVRLVLHDVNGKSYYRDAAKNKLFSRIGPKAIGTYVGRWDPLQNTIRTDISDSDEE